MTDAKTTGKHVTETSLGSAASAKWRDTFTEEPDRWKSPRPDLARASGAKAPGATQQISLNRSQVRGVPRERPKYAPVSI